MSTQGENQGCIHMGCTSCQKCGNYIGADSVQLLSKLEAAKTCIADISALHEKTCARMGEIESERDEWRSKALDVEAHPVVKCLRQEAELFRAQRDEWKDRAAHAEAYLEDATTSGGDVRAAMVKAERALEVAGRVVTNLGGELPDSGQLHAALQAIRPALAAIRELSP